MKGMQGEVQNDGKHLFSTLKHFAAYGIPESGHNGARANIGMRQLFQTICILSRKQWKQEQAQS